MVVSRTVNPKRTGVRFPPAPPSQVYESRNSDPCHPLGKISPDNDYEILIEELLQMEDIHNGEQMNLERIALPLR